MITRTLIKEGLNKNTISLIESPSHDGTVAKIGNEWFYFGGRKAMCPPEEYMRTTKMDEIVEGLFEALTDIREERQVIPFDDKSTITEYGYYELVLNGVIETERSSAEEILMSADNIRAMACDDEGFQKIVAKAAEAEIVVAVLDTYTERIAYLNPHAKTSVPVQKLIAKCLSQKQTPVSVKITEYSKLPYLQVCTALGEFKAKIEPKEITGDDDRLYIGFEPANGESRADRIDLARVKVNTDGIEMQLWYNIFNETEEMGAEIAAQEVKDYIMQYGYDEATGLAEKIRNASEWNKEDLSKLCEMAGLEREWKESDGENFEQVAYKAAEILGVEI